MPARSSLLEAIEAETTIPLEAREMLALLGQEIEHLDTRLKEIETKLTAMHKAKANSQLLATIPGIGPIIPLTPRSRLIRQGSRPSSGGLGSKGIFYRRQAAHWRPGHERLRQLLVTGATAVIKLATRPGNRLATEWLLKLLQHKRQTGRGRAGEQNGADRVGYDDERRDPSASAGCRCGLRLTAV